MPNIRVDQDVYIHLKERAEPFVDTPNSVLRRILGLDGQEDQKSPSEPPETASDTVKPQVPRSRSAARSTRRRTRKRSPRAAAGSLLPEHEYVEPLIQALAESGGSGPAREIIDSVGKRLGDRLTALDHEPLKSGVVRWQNRVQFVRLRLVEEGLLAKDTPRGVWALTEAGRSRASAVA